MNYISHLNGVLECINRDQRLKPTHVSLYMALFQFWNLNRFGNPISINRGDTMKISKIGSNATYHKCITQLSEWGYLEYIPSYNPMLGSLINMYNFSTGTGTTTEAGSKQVLNQVLYPSINGNKQKKQLNIKNNFRDDSLIVPKEKMKSELFSQPAFEDVKEFFISKNRSSFEAEKFFNHFEANGWLVGGKTKMKNWNAAARNWMLNAEKFNAQFLNKKQNGSGAGHLHVDQNKDYNIPL